MSTPRLRGFLIYSTVDGCLGYFQSLAVMHCYALHGHMCVSWHPHAAVYLGFVCKMGDLVLYCLANARLYSFLIFTNWYF